MSLTEAQRRANAARNGPKMRVGGFRGEAGNRATCAKCGGVKRDAAQTTSTPANAPAKITPTGPVGSVQFFASAGFPQPEIMACAFVPSLRSYFTKDDLIRVQQLAPNVFSQLVQHANLEAAALQKWTDDGGKVVNFRYPPDGWSIGAARDVLRSNPLPRPTHPVTSAESADGTPDTWGLRAAGVMPHEPTLSLGERIVKQEQAAKAFIASEREEWKQRAERMEAHRAAAEKSKPPKPDKRGLPDTYGLQRAAEERSAMDVYLNPPDPWGLKK